MCVWCNQGEAFRYHHYELQVQPTILLLVELVLLLYLEGSLLSSSQFFFFPEMFSVGILLLLFSLCETSNAYYVLIKCLLSSL